MDEVQYEQKQPVEPGMEKIIFRKHKNLSPFPISPDSEMMFVIDILPHGGVCNIMGMSHEQ